MPPRKKGHSSNNKKKGRNARSGRSKIGVAPPRPPTLPSETPDFSEYKQRSPASKNYGTMYTRYKEATNRFYDFMMDQTPDDVRGKPSVNALVPAVDWMQAQEFMIPKAVLNDLKIAIRMRSRVAKSVYGGGDEGHGYFLSVLLYCWTILVALPRSESARPTCDESEVEAGESNRYAVLEEEIGDDEEEDTESDLVLLPLCPVARPEPQPEPMTLMELVKAEYMQDASYFLFCLDDLMGFVADRYKTVTTSYEFYKDDDGITSTALVETMLEAAVATSMAIQQVHALEMALQAQHPHLSTPYRVLAAMVFSDITLRVTGILTEHATKKSSEQEVNMFLGDCLACAFWINYDDLNRLDAIATAFCTAFKVDAEGTSQIETVVRNIHKWVLRDLPMGKMEKAQAALWSQHMGETCSHFWLRKSRFIGGDRSIHHTIRLLQKVASRIQDAPDECEIEIIPATSDYYGPPWQPGQSRTIHGDLDGLFLLEIIPKWVNMCREGIIGQSGLPFERELCPLFVAFRDYAKSPAKPMSWSLAFAAHAMLTSILETDEICDKLTVFQKDVFTDYFDNVEGALESAQTEEGFCRNKVFVHYMSVVYYLKNLGHDTFDGRALWNPLSGGTLLSYVAYFGNLKVGCRLVDCCAQLRITLHLFNALLVNELIEPGQLPFLDTLHSAFGSSRGVWEGPLPERGHLVQRFWMCCGLSVQDAKRMAVKARRDLQDGRAVRESLSLLVEDASYHSSMRQRKAKPIDPAELSTSFRRICNRDFHGVQDNYYTPEERRQFKDPDRYAFAVRSNDTMDAIAEEQHFLSLHLPSFGAILEQFVCRLSRTVQWDPLLSNATVVDDKRGAFVVLFAQQLLGALDFAETPEDFIFSEKPTVRASTDFLTTYFGQIDGNKTLWFQPC